MGGVSSNLRIDNDVIIIRIRRLYLFHPYTTFGVNSDPSGELFRLTSGYLRQIGYRIAVLDVSNPDRSLSFNPLSSAGTHNQVERVCEILVSSAFPNDTGANKFWADSARGILSVLIRCLNNCDPEYRNLGNVRRLLNYFSGDMEEIKGWISEHADESTFSDAKGIFSNSDRGLANIVSTARCAVGAFGDPSLCRISSSNTLGIHTLREVPTIIYVIAPEEQIRFFGFWLSLVFTAIFDSMMTMEETGKPYLPVKLIIDEAGNISIPSFSLYCSTLRKRKCSVLLACQHHQQLVNLYGKAESDTIMRGAISNHIYLPGLALDTCVELERILGKQTVEDRRTGQRFSRSLKSASEIRTMPDDTGVYISANSKPIRLKLTPFYHHPKFKKYAKFPPAVIVGSENKEPEYIPVLSGKNSSIDSSGSSQQTQTVHTDPHEGSTVFVEKIAKEITEQFEKIITDLTGPALRQAVLLNTLNNDAVIPLTEAMRTLGISRDVAERLRKEKKLRPIVTKNGRNSKLYVTIGHIRHLVRQMNEAPVPARRGKVRKKSKKAHHEGE